MGKRLTKISKIILLVLIVSFCFISFSACNADKKNTQSEASKKLKIENLDKIIEVSNDIELPNIDNIRYIERVPTMANYQYLRTSITSLNDADETAIWKFDVRGGDLSKEDLTDRLDDLLHTCFDGKTIWPDKLPDGFNPQEIMEKYKNPGLNVRELHKKGINGRGVGIAIIDQSLLVDHNEYKDNLVYYQEYIKGDYNSAASMHGPAVASIAVGKNVGVAPEADLYFFNTPPGDFGETNDDFKYNYKYRADSINKIIEINNKLPENRKIRVISISLAFDEEIEGYEEFNKAVKKARDNGIETITVPFQLTEKSFCGMGRKPDTDGNNINDCCLSLLWMNYENNPINCSHIYVPMDFRCTASRNGRNDYVVYPQGGISWTVPYMAGLYALACQVEPDMNYSKFIRYCYDTGKEVYSTYELNGITYNCKMDRVVSPIDLIAKIQSTD